MPLSWNEIRHRAIAFSKEWTGAKSERAEKQTFWNEFFNVFGIRRRVVASFEEPVQKISGTYGYIDLFWPKIVLVEHKSLGGDLGKAQSQAFSYIRDLAREGRTDEIPRYIIISDFARIALHDLESDDQRPLPLFDNRPVETTEFSLADLHDHIRLFAFIAGYKQHKLQEHDPINIEAVEIMGRLHDALEQGGYSGHKLERFLVRILFCLFAQDTGIFEPESFKLYVENRTAQDGSDLGLHLARLFDVLDTPSDQRQRNLETLDVQFTLSLGKQLKDFYFEEPEFSVRHHKEVSAAARRIKEAEVGDLSVEPSEIGLVGLYPFKFRIQIVEKERPDDFEDIPFVSVVAADLPPLGRFHDGLEEGAKDRRRDSRPIETRTGEQSVTHVPIEVREGQVFSEQLAVDIWKSG